MVNGAPKTSGGWYFSRAEIENNSPSRRDGIDLKKESELRQSYCSLIQDLGMRLGAYVLPQCSFYIDFCISIKMISNDQISYFITMFKYAMNIGK